MKAEKMIPLPTEIEAEQAKISSRTLSKYAHMDRVRLTLQGGASEPEDLILPGQTLQILLDVLTEIGKGNAISLIPRHQEISTQEAADLLNVSRPFLINLLHEGKIPYHKVGTHRRVLLQDVLSYKQATYIERIKVLNELTAFSQKEDMGY